MLKLKLWICIFFICRGAKNRPGEFLSSRSQPLGPHTARLRRNATALRRAVEVLPFSRPWRFSIFVELWCLGMPSRGMFVKVPLKKQDPEILVVVSCRLGIMLLLLLILRYSHRVAPLGKLMPDGSSSAAGRTADYEATRRVPAHTAVCVRRGPAPAADACVPREAFDPTYEECRATSCKHFGQRRHRCLRQRAEDIGHQLQPRSQSAPHARQAAAATAPLELNLPTFHPALPRISAASAGLATLLQVLADGQTRQCVLDEHTRLCLARVRWWVAASSRGVPCVLLQNIEVDPPHRQCGHARRALLSLCRAAGDGRLALIVYNVTSQHMHTLVRTLDGVRLPETAGRSARDGCSYWLASGPASLALHRVDVRELAPYGLPSFRLGLEVHRQPQP